MDAKLKALKVVDLKNILHSAGVSTPSKSNKNDLIARILASPVALDAYNAQHSPKTSEPAPEQSVARQEQPSQVDTSPKPPTKPAPHASVPNTHSLPAVSRQAATPPSLKPVLSDAPALPAATTATPLPTATSTSNPNLPEDQELEKLKARAARFGIPLVEPTKHTGDATKRGNTTKLTAAAPDDPEKLAARAARFGIIQAAVPAQPATQSNGRKRSAPSTEAADAEELERRRKRAERFGNSVVGTKA